jgi:hypothetical protein
VVLAVLQAFSQVAVVEVVLHMVLVVVENMVALLVKTETQQLREHKVVVAVAQVTS